MRSRDTMALLIAAGVGYWLWKRQGASGAPTSLDVVSGNAVVGFLDQTQSVQYDPATGNLWDVSGPTNVLIATIAPGRNASVFADPAVQALILNAPLPAGFVL